MTVLFIVPLSMLVKGPIITFFPINVFPIEVSDVEILFL